MIRAGSTVPGGVDILGVLSADRDWTWKISSDGEEGDVTEVEEADAELKWGVLDVGEG